MTTDDDVRKLEARLEESHRTCAEAKLKLLPWEILKVRGRGDIVRAVTVLVSSPEIESGLMRCVRAGLAHETYEQIVTEFPTLFDAKTITLAREKLEFALRAEGRDQ